jgi:hypothetical protein
MLLLLLFAGLALYVMTSEERRRLVYTASTTLRDGSGWMRRHGADSGPFGDALRARTPFLIVTPASSPRTSRSSRSCCSATARWATRSSSFAGAPASAAHEQRQWWRLTATFVHGSVLALLVNTNRDCSSGCCSNG